jgi:tetratricopeptide (TPR) repeat protein
MRAAAILVATLALGAAGPLHAQQSSSNPTPPAQPAPAPQYPFPEAQSEAAAAAASQPADANAPAAPAPNTPPNSNHPAFPEDVSHAAAVNHDVPDSNTLPRDNTAPPVKPDESSSRAGTAGFDPNAPDKKVALKDEGSFGNPPDPKRVSNDMQVAKFYWNIGDWKGSYLRYKDALAFKPDDAEAMFGLAESERQLKMYSDARVHYQAYLQLQPNGHRAKDAKKALADLPAGNG